MLRSPAPSEVERCSCQGQKSRWRKMHQVRQLKRRNWDRKRTDDTLHEGSKMEKVGRGNQDSVMNCYDKLSWQVDQKEP